MEFAPVIVTGHGLMNTLRLTVWSNLNVNDRQDADRYLEQLLTVVPAKELRVLLQGDPGKNFLPAESKAKIIKFIDNSAT